MKFAATRCCRKCIGTKTSPENIRVSAKHILAKLMSNQSRNIPSLLAANTNFAAVTPIALKRAFAHHIAALLLILIAVSPVFPQGGTADAPLFILPVDIDPVLVANFGELRNNHFHGGIDLKTEHVTGKNLLAIADGYVSRIKLEPAGYGMILFITHPQYGIIAGYAHMLALSPRIDSVLFDYQMQVKTNHIDYADIPPKLLPVKQGDIVGLSGNSGASTGPHLHFEIRDLITGDGLNPLAYFPQLTEHAAPTIFSIIATPIGTASTVNGQHQPLRIAAVRKSNGRFVIAGTLRVQGAIGFSVSSIDRFTGSPHTFGIYTTALYLDGALMHRHSMDDIPYTDTRFLNAFVDYPRKMRTGVFYEKTYIEPGNQLNIYAHGTNQGIIITKDSERHTAAITATDIYGNESKVEIPLQFEQYQSLGTDSTLTDKYWKDFSKMTDEYYLFVPKGALFTNDRITVSKVSAKASRMLSPTFRFHTPECPTFLPVTVGIKADTSMLANKTGLIICRVNNGGGLHAETSFWQGDYLCAESKYFGNFCIARDLTPPNAASLNLRNGANARALKTVRFRVADNLSGINQYNAFIDDNWTPVVYDRKTAVMEVDLLNRVVPVDGKKHTIKLVLVDAAGNRKTVSYAYYR